MTHLEPCPFCGHELEQRHRRYNPYARCATDDCMGGKLPLISLDVPGDIERWNRRGREQALAAHVERLREAVEFCNEHHHFGGWTEMLDEAPATPLARLKAQWQAEAVSEFAFRHLGGHEQEVAEIYASKLRRQADEQ